LEFSRWILVYLHEELYEANRCVMREGPEKLSAVVTALQHRFPGSAFKTTSPIQENFGVGRVAWEYGSPAGTAIAKGIDVGRIKDGKLVALHVFID
jgi:hypothetical protein